MESAGVVRAARLGLRAKRSPGDARGGKFASKSATVGGERRFVFADLPPFIVGQLKGSANVTQGNTVLVGHLNGDAGAVFNKLDDLSPGDAIVAVSRGLEYRFVVSDKETLPSDDTEPAAPYDRPRLTLMTCSGTWDPIAHDYSDRLWVTAEPPDLAAVTIAANIAHPRRTPVPTPSADDSQAADPSTLVAATGLGAERAALDSALGPPLGETPGKLVGVLARVHLHGLRPGTSRLALLTPMVAATSEGSDLESVRSVYSRVEDAQVIVASAR